MTPVTDTRADAANTIALRPRILGRLSLVLLASA